MADPVAARDEDHADGRQHGDGLGVVSRSGRHPHVRDPEAFGGGLQGVDEERVTGGGAAQVVLLEGDVRLVPARDFASQLLETLIEGLDRLHPEVPDLQGQVDCAGNDVRRAGMRFDAADRGYLPSRPRLGLLVDRHQEPAGGHQRVPADSHRGGARVVCEP